MSRRIFTGSRGSFSVLAGLAGGLALSCQSGGLGSEVGPICPECVAGGESSDFNGGSVPPIEHLCEAYHVLSERLDAEGTRDDELLVEDVRRRLSAAAIQQFQWSAPANVESGAPATGYSSGIIDMEIEFEFGETFVERLDPATCAGGYCLRSDELARCALREERWLRQDFDVRLKTSDRAIDATLSGSARITRDGRFATGPYVQGGQPQVSAASVNGTLRLAPSVPGEPVVGAHLDLFESQLSGGVAVRLDASSGTGEPYFPTYAPLSGGWPVHRGAADGETADGDCPWATVPTPADIAHDWLGGKAPQQLAAEVRGAIADPQPASWDSGGAEVVQVIYDASAGSRACVGLSAIWLPQQRVTVATVEAGDVHWEGLLIHHEAGELVGFESSARFEYNADNDSIGERIAALEELEEDRQSVKVSVRDAKRKVDSGYGTWTATAFPAWDLTVSRSRGVDCPGPQCRAGEPLACMGTDEHGYNACDGSASLPTVCVDPSDLVNHILVNQPQTPVSPSTLSVSPEPAEASSTSVAPVPITCSPRVDPVTPSGSDASNPAGIPDSEPSVAIPADAGMREDDGSL